MVVDRSLHQLTCEAKVHKSLKHPCLQTIQCTNSSPRHVWKARPFSSFLGWQVEASSTTTLETSHNASLVNIVMEMAASQGLNPPPIKVWSRRVPLFVLQCFFWHLKRRLFLKCGLHDLFRSSCLRWGCRKQASKQVYEQNIISRAYIRA